MKKLHRIRVTALVIGISVLAICAQAGTITEFSDRPTFNGAVGPVTLETFTNVGHFPINPAVLNSATNQPGIGITPGTIQAGVTYTAPISGSGPEFNIDTGENFAGGFLDSILFGASSRPLTVTFDGPVTGFGFDTDRLGGTQMSIVVNFTSGPAFSTRLDPAATLTFFGFQSSAQDITGFTLEYINPNTFGFALDNFAFTAPGSVADTPEPSSILLMGAGLMALTAIRRLRAKAIR